MNLFWLIYGVLIIAGGAVGYLKAKSKASLIAGSISGVLIILSGYWISQGFKAGILVGHLISLALLAKFGVNFVKTKKPFPSLMIIPMALAGVVYTLYLVTR